MSSAPRQIEFWFDLGSNYSYLTAMRVDALAEGAGVKVLWRPFMLGAIFQGFGWSSSPFVLQKEKGEYVWHDMERLARKYGIGWKQPTTFPRAAVYPMRVAAAHQDAPWVPAFCKALFRMNFVDDQDINDNAVCVRVLDSLGVPGAQLVNGAQTDENRARLRRQTEGAQRRKIFGAPMLFAGTEMFWGNDRLEDAIELAAQVT
jgi:2-hydroxychromene-2-carboxylate isomerase